MKFLIVLLSLTTAIASAAPANNPFHATGTSEIHIGVEGQIAVSIDGEDAELLYTRIIAVEEKPNWPNAPFDFQKTSKNQKVICYKTLPKSTALSDVSSHFKCSFSVDLQN